MEPACAGVYHLAVGLYRLPYTQVWYLELQQALPHDIVMNVGYSGAKGTRLDLISARGFYNNRSFADVFFDFEDSAAFSNFNALICLAADGLGIFSIGHRKAPDTLDRGFAYRGGAGYPRFGAA